MNIVSYFKRLLIYKLKRKKKIIKSNFENKNLNYLFEFFKTDKSNKEHGFAIFYEKHLKYFRKSEINILEIGAGKGASAAAFGAYFERSKIFSMDNHIENFAYQSENIFPVLIDSSNEKSIIKFYNKIPKKKYFFDLIIEDGSHRLNDILLSIKYHFKKIKPGGYFVLEDYLFPNYFDHCNNNSNEIKIDEMIQKIKKKFFFPSEILDKEFQNYLFENIDFISEYKGKTQISDICFIKKRV